MILFTYRDGQSVSNEAQATKQGAEGITYLLEFVDGIPSGVTLSSAATVALDSTGATQTTNCVLSTATSGTIATVTTKTMGTSGTSPATDGARFRLRTTVTLSAGGPLSFDVFFLVRNKAYLPV